MMTGALGVVLFLAAAAWAIPDPQEGSSGSRTYETDKCDRAAYSEWVSIQLECFNDAETPLNELFAAPSSQFTPERMREAMCASVTATVNCMDNNSRTCYNEEESRNVKINYLIKEFRKAFNATDFLGANIFDECPVFVRNEDELTQRIGGASVCRFVELETRYRDFKACEDKADAEVSAKMDLLSLAPQQVRRNLFVNTHCEVRDTYFKVCLPPLLACMGDEDGEGLKEGRRNYFSRMESAIQENVLPDFTFESECSFGNEL